MITERYRGCSTRRLVVFTVLMIFQQFSTMANDLVKILDLKGNWKFSIGERDEWKLEKCSDADWETIRVPSPWEDQGFNGYNGYATYRKTFTISGDTKGRMLYINLGYIDDVDEAYINGQKVGSTGSFPPEYETAYNAERKYYIPPEIIHYDGTNVITVVVYDSYQYGGIVSGDIGIFAGKSMMNLDVNLQGKWKFHAGDDLNRKSISFDDSSWDELLVPGKWEDQHYRDYDGYAWYRKEFIYKGTNENEHLVLYMGKIDDIDQVYLNGSLVGTTGKLTSKENEYVSTGEEWKAIRGYYLPVGLLKKNKVNVISIRVFDSGGDGGIYEGPIGILTQTNYIEYWRKNKNLNK